MIIRSEATMKKSPKKIPVKKISVKQLDTLWSKKIRDKYEGKCAVCGATPVQAHHIFSRSYKSTRWDLDNGIALCYKHHFFLAHSKFEEFRDFLFEHIGEERYNQLKEKSRLIIKPEYDLIKDTLS